VLTPADVGHAIRLGESASDAGGASRSVVSAATAAVVAAPASPALRASLSGLSAGRPRLVLDLTAATSGPAFQRLAISLPAGLALRRATAITLSAGGRALQPRAVHAAGRTLTVRLPRPLSTLRIIVAFPSLSARASLRRAARRPAALRLTLVVQLRAIPGAAPIPPATATLRVIP
jgi:hypothetical protein